MFVRKPRTESASVPENARLDITRNPGVESSLLIGEYVNEVALFHQMRLVLATNRDPETSSG